MSDLAQWQKRFSDTLFSHDPQCTLPGLNGLIPATVATAIYRNNVLKGFRLALSDTYRAVAQLLGEDCFREICYGYCVGYPSLQGDRNTYGEHMAKYLAGHPLTQSLLYLPDIARLEWQQHECYRADDSFLANGLHASVRLVESIYPILAIWNLCQDPEQVLELDLDQMPGESLLLARLELEVVMRPVSGSEVAWYRRLLQGEDPSVALHAITTEYPDQSAADFCNRAHSEGFLLERQ
jgi:hypothetical protein